MPNHVTTIIEAPQNVLDALKDAEGKVDFNLLIPQPENIEVGGCSGKHEPGVICWYTWSLENWGTKWNAYSQDDTPGGYRTTPGTALQFDTAWAHPEPIIFALSEKFPDVEITVHFADEDLGSNLGSYIILDGEIENVIPYGSDWNNPAVMDFAARVKYGRSYADLKAEWGEEDQG
jgi:Ferredoxin-like domain in Api92-like protein